MEKSYIKRNKIRNNRKLRVRKTLRGNAQKPRLCVVKSNTHIYAQVIDDENQVTLVSASTMSKEFKSTEFNKKSCASGEELGKVLAKLLKAKKVEKVIFDRGRFKYHGVLAAVAKGARDGGLQF